MQLNEVFGWRKEKTQQDWVNIVNAEINEQKRYLRYAHSSQGHQDKHDYINMVITDFKALYARIQSGEDVTNELKQLYHELKKARGFW